MKPRSGYLLAAPSDQLLASKCRPGGTQASLGLFLLGIHRLGCCQYFLRGHNLLQLEILREYKTFTGPLFFLSKSCHIFGALTCGRDCTRHFIKFSSFNHRNNNVEKVLLFPFLVSKLRLREAIKLAHGPQQGAGDSIPEMEAQAILAYVPFCLGDCIDPHSLVSQSQ